jgi:GNAT superfamily N-acetyltransferase
VHVALHLGGEDRELAALLDTRIHEFNVQETGQDDGRMLTIRAADDAGTLVAGLSGWTWGGCGYVDVLWVVSSHRGAGVGSRLLAAAEDEALARGCAFMALSTHSFQAPDFYRRRGYAEVGSTPEYPKGHAQLHFRKDLAPAG